MYFQVNGETISVYKHRLLNENEVLKVLRNSGQNGVPEWFDRINRIYLRSGFDPSSATVLLRRKAVDQINPANFNQSFRIAPRFLPTQQHFTLSGFVFKSAESLTPSFSFQRFAAAQQSSVQYPYDQDYPDDQVCLVEFEDVRCQFHRASAAGLYYNVISSTQHNSGPDTETVTYYSSTTNSGPAYTWVEVLQDLWSQLPTSLTLDTTNFKVPLATGTSLTFTPYNVIGDGLTVWELFQKLVDATGHALCFNGAKFFLRSYGFASDTESSLSQILRFPYENRIVYHTSNFQEADTVPYSTLTFFPTGDVSANAVARDDIPTQYEVGTGTYRHVTTDTTSLTLDRNPLPDGISSATDMLFVDFNVSTSIPEQLIDEIGPELARRHCEYILSQKDSYSVTLTGNHAYPREADHKHSQIVISQEAFGISISYDIGPPKRIQKILPSSGGSGAAAAEEAQNGVGIITASASAAAYTDSTNTLVCGEPTLRTFRDQTGGTLTCLDVQDNAYWAGDESISLTSGKGRLCYWQKIGGEFFVEPSCNEIDFDISNPSITTTTSQNVDEGTTAVVTVTGTDIDADAVFSISGGADSAFFEIDEESGDLSFKNAPDYDSPLDANGDNVYLVTVQVLNCDGETDEESFSVTVVEVP